METNRFTPPQAHVADVPAVAMTRPGRRAARAFAWAAAAMTFWLVFGRFVLILERLMETSAIAPAIALLIVVAIVTLPIGAVLLAWRGRGRYFLIVAACAWGLILLFDRSLLEIATRYTLPPAALSVVGVVLSFRLSPRRAR